MKSPTFTVISGNMNCTCDCPICISKMTPSNGTGYLDSEVNWRNFEMAVDTALNYNAENVLITGKGEPTLYPAQITKYLHKLYGKQFNRRELQTNGFLIAKNGLVNDFLEVWYDLGLVTVAVSVYHYNSIKNAEVFRPRKGEHFNLAELIEKIHKNGLEARLSCVMLNGYIDGVAEVEKLILFAKENRVEQLTLRRADRPKNPRNMEIANYVDEHRLSEEQLEEIADYLTQEGKLCSVLPHGAKVYEINSQNVCITTGLTTDNGKEDVRQLIFFPSGLLTTSWETVYGSAILRGWNK